MLTVLTALLPTLAALVLVHVSGLAGRQQQFCRQEMTTYGD